MSLNTLRAAIETRITTEFANAPALQVAYQNVPFTPPNNASWVQVNISWGEGTYLTILTNSNRGTGDGFNQKTGVLLFNIFTPKAEGSGAMLTIAQRCIDLFSRLQVSNIKFDAANGPRTVEASLNETGISAGSSLAASFNQAQVTITFEAYEQS